MNTSLSIRLNVHETLPRHLRNWRIQSGRATFVIENELEFDVVSFVEDASDQWWFIDLRILFSPAPLITVGSHFFLRLKQQADYVLQKQGLVGLFDFLLNFVLTHKISVLRSQAMGLALSGWAGSLKVEPVHRELVVQYWIDRPGKKSWLEIGIANNKLKKGKTSWRGPPIPSITVRWFRQGQEVKDAALKLDLRQLSFERLIKRVISLHTNKILQATREFFHSGIAVNSGLSESEPTDCKLQVTLGASTNSITLSLETVTGAYILQPATALAAMAEKAFNQGREPKQIANVVTQLLAQTLRDLVQKYAQQLGWHQIARQALRLDLIKAVVKLDILQYVMYSPRGWSPNWAFVSVIDPSGTSWWIFEIVGNGSTIEYAEQITFEKPDAMALSIDRDTLASLERVAVQLLSTRVTTRELLKERKPFSLRFETGKTETKTEARGNPRGWTLYLQTADLLTTATAEQPWLESHLAIVCQGLRPQGRNVWHIAAGRMVKTVAADMQKLMAASPQNGFKFAADGSFRILLSTKFGQDILGELRARLRDVNRLRSFATTLQKREMLLRTSSLQRVQFQYGPAQHVAAVQFTSEKEVTVEMPHKNPHYRVHKLLTEIANERVPSFPFLFLGDTNGLDRFCTTLILTRPVLTALDALEKQGSNSNLRNPAIHVHSIFKYRITYENPVCSFDIRTQSKDDKVYWFVDDNLKNHAQDLRPTPERGEGHRRLDTVQAKLKELFHGKGERWFGTRTGLVAELDGVPDALKKLNEAVLSCTMEGGYRAPPPVVEAPAPNPTQGQGQTQIQNPNQNRRQSQNQNQQQVNGQQQARAQQARQQQQTQNQARKPQQQNPNQRGQMPNGRQQQQHHQQHGKQGGRPGQQMKQHQQQDIIEID
jgi:mediator of RNA polymerase II transcription subunit 14